MELLLITPPTTEPVTLTEAKNHLRLDLVATGEDVEINALIQAAREYCEDYQNRAYITQTWDLMLDGWPRNNARYDSRTNARENPIKIPLPPLQSVTSITYTTSEGEVKTMPSTDYIVAPGAYGSRIALASGKSWPSEALQTVQGIKIRFVAGYPTKTGTPNDPAGNVPQKVKRAMLMLIGHWYENRETVTVGSSIGVSKEIELATHRILKQDRVVPI